MKNPFHHSFKFIYLFFLIQGVVLTVFGVVSLVYPRMLLITLAVLLAVIGVWSLVLGYKLYKLHQKMDSFWKKLPF